MLEEMRKGFMEYFTKMAELQVLGFTSWNGKTERQTMEASEMKEMRKHMKSSKQYHVPMRDLLEGMKVMMNPNAYQWTRK